MAENSSRILKWFIQLSNFDFDIVYKPGYLKCLADMLTREQSEKATPSLSMFSVGASSLRSGRGTTPLCWPRNGLFLKPWDESISEAEWRQLLDYASRNEAERFLDLTLIKQIQSSPLKIEIMERREKDAYINFENAPEKLKNCGELRIDQNEEKDGPLWYVDIEDGNLTWTSYNLTRLLCNISTFPKCSQNSYMHHVPIFS